MTRAEILDKAKQIVTTDRNARYGEPEDNFDVIAQFWNNYLTTTQGVCLYLSAPDVAIMMALFKIGRIATARDMNKDSYIDAAGYIACAAECAVREEERIAKSEKWVETIRAKYGIGNGTL